MNKIIHYCWFGKTKKSKKILRCIDSWSKYFPGWQIKEWNESNFDISCCDYVKKAYEMKKWAFVSDYCRFYVLSVFGGIYFDVDVEVIKQFPDSFFESPFLGLEKAKMVSIAPGLVMYTNSKDAFCEAMIDSYKNDKFEKDGLYFKTVCERANEYFKKYGFIEEDKFQQVGKYKIYPSEFFSPINNYTKEIKMTKNTLSIHYYLGSWLTFKEKFSIGINRLMRKLKLR